MAPRVTLFCSYHIWHHLWSITCPWQGFPPAFLQTSKICHYPFMILDWERHWERHCGSEVFYPRTQHIDLACTQTCASQPRVQYNDHKATASPTDIKFVVRTKKTLEVQLHVLLMCYTLPHFDIICNILLYRPTASWNLFILYDIEAKCWYWWHHLCVCPPVDDQ